MSLLRIFFRYYFVRLIIYDAALLNISNAYNNIIAFGNNKKFTITKCRVTVRMQRVREIYELRQQATFASRK